MLISGFSYVRNGFEYGYPFLQAIQSALPVCDEFIVVVGDSSDGTREAIAAIGSPKIRIVDTVWDMNLRVGGKVFAQQSNRGVEEIKGEWGFHIQADEVIHENDIHKIREAVEKYRNRKEVDGFLLPFMHFWGGYHHLRTSRRTHRFEIRVFRNDKVVRAYRDSQGFRKYSSAEAYEKGEKGIKLNVVKLDVPVYHYSYARPPKLMKKKDSFFGTFYNPQAARDAKEPEVRFDYEHIDKLEPFTGEHPALMREKVEGQDWEFTYDPSMASMPFRYRVLHFIEDLTGYRLFEYKNYRRIKP